MATKLLSCGILVRSPKGWLLAHATMTPRWDIPKGKIEEGETPIEAALRETIEETGIDLSDKRELMRDMGRHAYIPKKDLHLFVLDVDEAFDLTDCKCSTVVEGKRGTYPEADRWEWVHRSQLRARLGKGMIAYMEARGLLCPSIEREPGVGRQARP